MKVLLMTPPYIEGFMRNARWDALTVSGSDWYLLYLGYSTALLERETHEAKLLDAQVDKLSPGETYRIAKELEYKCDCVANPSKKDFLLALKECKENYAEYQRNCRKTAEELFGLDREKLLRIYQRR